MMMVTNECLDAFPVGAPGLLTCWGWVVVVMLDAILARPLKRLRAVGAPGLGGGMGAAMMGGTLVVSVAPSLDDGCSLLARDERRRRQMLQFHFS